MNLDTLESLLIVIVQTACIFWVTSYLETHLKIGITSFCQSLESFAIWHFIF
ncbi:hypothetical protein SNF32_00070 [Enterococcus mundtii]|nr:hypothetical protein [Enterococcus mundtii]